jgi:hypothetical protein
MNALPVRGPTPQEIIDDLIAEFGIRKDVVATVARLLRRTRPPDIALLRDQPGVADLGDRLRIDIGLPPLDQSQKIAIDLISAQQRL